MSPSRRLFRSRRSVLRVLGLAGSGFLTGCGESSSAGQNAGTTLTTESTTRRTSTTEPSTPAPLPPEGTINAIPTKPDAQWSDAGVFDILDGDVDYELNLKEARGRHYDDLEQWAASKGDLGSPLLTDFVDKVLTDAGWREDITYEYNNFSEYIHEREDPFRPDEYQKDAPFGERMKDSNFQTFWHMFSYVAYGGPSSTQNQPKAAVIQGLERKIGADTIVWGHQSGHGGHGLISALENPTYDPEKFDRQHTYVIETDPDRDYQVMNLAEEGYRNNGAHPAEEGGKEMYEEGMWLKMNQSSVVQDYAYIRPNSTKKLTSFLLNPASDSGQKYMDLAAIAYDLAKDDRFAGREATITVDAESIAYQ